MSNPLTVAGFIERKFVMKVKINKLLVMVNKLVDFLAYHQHLTVLHSGLGQRFKDIPHLVAYD